jgi:hypothetical protein
MMTDLPCLANRYEVVIGQADEVIAHTPPMLLPIPHVHHGELLKKGPHVPVMLGPKDKMLVIGHQTIGADSHRTTLMNLRMLRSKAS